MPKHDKERSGLSELPAQVPAHVMRLGDLPARRATEALLEPGPQERAAIAAALGLTGLRKMRFAARLAPEGGRDWILDGTLGATVVQPCVVTLAPVSTRIDERVTRRYLAAFELPEGGTEVEMPEDDVSEPLPQTLDLYAVAIEALALALPQFPRSEEAAMAEARFAAPGIAPMTDEETRPFAGLADLRDRLAGDAENAEDGGPQNGAEGDRRDTGDDD